MQPVRISDTIQEFNGERYYLCGAYFQYKGKRLHRAVWEHHNGPVPAGHHVHHVDGNRHNNTTDNLQLVEGGKHLRVHMRSADRKEKSRQAISASAQPAAREWHGSAEGLAWHSEQGKANWERRSMHIYGCDYCGKAYRTKYVYPEGSRHFCCANCKMKARRRRLNAGQDSQASR